jgi:hypothetical protein
VSRPTNRPEVAAFAPFVFAWFGRFAARSALGGELSVGSPRGGPSVGGSCSVGSPRGGPSVGGTFGEGLTPRGPVDGGGGEAVGGAPWPPGGAVGLGPRGCGVGGAGAGGGPRGRTGRGAGEGRVTPNGGSLLPPLPFVFPIPLLVRHARGGQRQVAVGAAGSRKGSAKHA